MSPCPVLCSFPHRASQELHREGCRPWPAVTADILGSSVSDLEVTGMFYLAGIDYRVKTVRVDDTQVALQLWDTAGQER